MIARRHFLGSLAAGTFAFPAFSRGAAPPPGQPSLGFSLYGMKSLSLDVALETCAKIGYSHVEFALNAGYATEPSVFSPEARRAAAAKLQELKLGLPSLMVLMNLTADDSAHAQALRQIAEAGKLAYELVPAQPPLLETILGGSPSKWEQQKSGMAEKLNDWAAAAERAKCVIAIKAHVGSAVNSPERILWLLEQVASPAIQLAYDYSHFELQGIGLEASLKLLLPRTRFIHVKDTAGDASKFQFLLPGEGRTNYVQYFTLLRRHGYTGPVCVEVSGQIFNKPGYDPIAAARQCYAALSAALQQSLPQN